MRFRQALLPLFFTLPLFALHCGEDTTATPSTTDAGSNTAADTGTPDAQDSGSTDTGEYAPEKASGECGTTKVCFDVASRAEEYRLGLVFLQLNDDGPDPEPETTYDKKVKAGQTHIEIALTDLGQPTDQKVFFCARATDDESASPCLNDPKVAYGIFFAYTDSDGNGELSDLKGDIDPIVGYGDVVIGYAEKSFSEPYPNDNDLWKKLWPTGIDGGTHIYQLSKPEGDTHQRPVKTTANVTNKIGDDAPDLQ